MSRTYRPSRTSQNFLHSDKRVQLLLGPIGGGKTVTALMKILMIAHAQRPNDKGLRRTRWACVRNTRPQLKDSVLKTVFDWLPPDGARVVWRESDMSLLLTLPLPDHTTVECEIMFRALDDERDARRLLSVEYTGVWFSEFREIPFKLHIDALSRCGRFPSASDGGCDWFGLIGESNMPTKGSDWHRFLELERPQHAEVFTQPSALSAEAENLQFLPPDYYTTLAAGATPGWIQAHITCEYPDSLDGKAVFSQTFFPGRHVSEQPLKVTGWGSNAASLIVGVDQGRSPAAIIGQIQPNGRLHILKELSASNMGMEAFARDKLVPLLAAEFPGIPVLAVIDPAGTHKNEVDDRTPMEALQAAGLLVMPAPTNKLDRRLNAVEGKLMLADGLLISCDCKVLIEGMANSYRYRTKKDGQLDDIPEKLHPWSDVCDALQYLCLAAGGQVYGRLIKRKFGGGRPQIQQPPSRAWT